ncbi:regulator of (H+)-ATPase in vacuolar membrane [Dimargaris verticillata]|uniref:Regulator of (H+)-ATPase in vacuolar membrane n=1 Tax=Dimargaris verticillata TaxID=2761393 RepID=A0A9W8AXU1_9FUNG|nr:regulator of (H+)-ATPase in vacuolar membrane [Dimargaris verticillata]
MDHCIVYYRPEVPPTSPTVPDHLRRAQWHYANLVTLDHTGTSLAWHYRLSHNPTAESIIVGSRRGVSRWTYDRSANHGQGHLHACWMKDWETRLASPCYHIAVCSGASSLFATRGRFDRTIKVWCPDADGTLRFIYLPHPHHVLDMIWLPPHTAALNPFTLVTVCVDGNTRVWSQFAVDKAASFVLTATILPNHWLASSLYPPPDLDQPLYDPTRDSPAQRLALDYPFVYWVDKQALLNSVPINRLAMLSSQDGVSTALEPAATTTHHFLSILAQMDARDELFMAWLPDGTLMFWSLDLTAAHHGHMASPHLLFVTASKPRLDTATCHAVVRHPHLRTPVPHTGMTHGWLWSAEGTLSQYHLVLDQLIPFDFGGAFTGSFRFGDELVSPISVGYDDRGGHKDGVHSTAATDHGTGSHSAANPGPYSFPTRPLHSVTSLPFVATSSAASLFTTTTTGEHHSNPTPLLSASSFQGVARDPSGWLLQYQWQGHHSPWPIVAIQSSDPSATTATTGPKTAKMTIVEGNFGPLILSLACSRPVSLNESGSSISLASLQSNLSTTSSATDSSAECVYYEWAVQQLCHTTTGCQLVLVQKGTLLAAWESDSNDANDNLSMDCWVHWLPMAAGFLICLDRTLYVYLGYPGLHPTGSQSAHLTPSPAIVPWGFYQAWSADLESYCIGARFSPMPSFSLASDTSCGRDASVQPLAFLLGTAPELSQAVLLELTCTFASGTSANAWPPKPAFNQCALNTIPLTIQPLPELTAVNETPGQSLLACRNQSTVTATVVTGAGHHYLGVDRDDDLANQPMLLMCDSTCGQLWLGQFGQNSDEDSIDRPSQPEAICILPVLRFHWPVDDRFVTMVRYSESGDLAIVTQQRHEFTLSIWNIYLAPRTPSSTCNSNTATSANLAGATPLYQITTPNPIVDMQWYQTPLNRPYLAYAVNTRVHIVSRTMLLDPSWTEIQCLDGGYPSSMPIQRLHWLPQGALVMGFASGVVEFVDQARIMAADHRVSNRASKPDSSLAASAVVPQYHPETLSSLLLWGREDLVQAILSQLTAELRRTSEGDENTISPTPLPIAHFLQSPSLSSLSPSSTQPATETHGDKYSGLFDHDSVAALPTTHADPHTLAPDTAAFLADYLSRHTLPGVPHQDQLRLVDIASLVVQMTHQYQSLDRMGRRFALFLRLYIQRTQPEYEQVVKQNASSPSWAASFAPAVLAHQLPFRDCHWAFHSESQPVLLDFIRDLGSHGGSSDHCGSKLLWRDARRLGVGYWLRDSTLVRALLEQMARQHYLQSDRDPLTCMLYYLALKKKSVLLALWKASHGHPQCTTMVKFLAHDFTEPRWKTAANKNAYVLLGKQKFELAASFFLLAGRLADALNVCVRQLHDPALAILLCRAYEGDNGDTLPWLLTEKLIPDAQQTNTPNPPDPWQLSLLALLASQRDQALQHVEHGLTRTDSVTHYDPSLLLLVSELETLGSAQMHSLTLPSKPFAPSLSVLGPLLTTVVSKSLTLYQLQGQPWVGWQVFRWWQDQLTSDQIQPSISNGALLPASTGAPDSFKAASPLWHQPSTLSHHHDATATGTVSFDAWVWDMGSSGPPAALSSPSKSLDQKQHDKNEKSAETSVSKASVVAHEDHALAQLTASQHRTAILTQILEAIGNSLARTPVHDGTVVRHGLFEQLSALVQGSASRYKADNGALLKHSPALRSTDDLLPASPPTDLLAAKVSRLLEGLSWWLDLCTDIFMSVIVQLSQLQLSTGLSMVAESSHLDNVPIETILSRALLRASIVNHLEMAAFHRLQLSLSSFSGPEALLALAYSQDVLADQTLFEILCRYGAPLLTEPRDLDLHTELDVFPSQPLLFFGTRFATVLLLLFMRCCIVYCQSENYHAAMLSVVLWSRLVSPWRQLWSEPAKALSELAKLAAEWHRVVLDPDAWQNYSALEFIASLDHHVQTGADQPAWLADMDRVVGPATAEMLPSGLAGGALAYGLVLRYLQTLLTLPQAKALVLPQLRLAQFQCVGTVTDHVLRDHALAFTRDVQTLGNVSRTALVRYLMQQLWPV